MSFLLEAAEKFPIGTRIRHKQGGEIRDESIRTGVVVPAIAYRASGRSTCRDGAFRGSETGEVYIAIRWENDAGELEEFVGCQSPNRIEKVPEDALQEAADKWKVGYIIYLPKRRSEERRWAEVIDAEEYHRIRPDKRLSKRKFLKGAYECDDAIFLALRYLSDGKVGNCKADSIGTFQWEKSVA